MIKSCTCDRCGKEFEVGDRINVVSIYNKSSYETVSQNIFSRSYVFDGDLCEFCYDELTSWVNEYKNSSHKNPFV